MTNADDAAQWKPDKLSALRLGRRLVTEVMTAEAGRRAFVDIRPVATEADRDASREGWVRPDRDRTFQLEHWDYDADRLDGFDHDIGAVLVRATRVSGEAELAAALRAWNLRPEQFRYPGETSDPR